jgi:hypothetical protein
VIMRVCEDSRVLFGLLRIPAPLWDGFNRPPDVSSFLFGLVGFALDDVFSLLPEVFKFLVGLVG